MRGSELAAEPDCDNGRSTAVREFHFPSADTRAAGHCRGGRAEEREDLPGNDGGSGGGFWPQGGARCRVLEADAAGTRQRGGRLRVGESGRGRKSGGCGERGGNAGAAQPMAWRTAALDRAELAAGGGGAPRGVGGR